MTQDHQPADAGTGSMLRRFAFILESVRLLGLLERKTETLSARLNPDLLRLAKDRTGVEANSALVELAIASLAAEDGFPDAFSRSRNRVPAELDLDV